MLAGGDQHRHIAARSKAPGKGCDLARSKGAVGISGDHADDAAAMGKKAASQVIDLIAKFFGGFENFLAGCSRNARARRESAGNGRPRYASLLRHFMGTDEAWATIGIVILLSHF